MQARGSIYGTVDAGRQWWLWLRGHVLELGWRESKLEQAFFLFFTRRGRELVLSGLLTSHVDDLFTAGEGIEYEESIKELSARICLSLKRVEFRFCGQLVTQFPDYTVKVSQRDGIEALEYAPIDRHRRTKPNLPLLPSELMFLRSVIGSTGWIARQSRFDCAAWVSFVAQSTGNPTMLCANKFTHCAAVLSFGICCKH